MFGTYDKKSGAQSEEVEALEIDVATIHYVERARFGKELVEDVDCRALCRR